MQHLQFNMQWQCIAAISMPFLYLDQAANDQRGTNCVYRHLCSHNGNSLFIVWLILILILIHGRHEYAITRHEESTVQLYSRLIKYSLQAVSH